METLIGFTGIEIDQMFAQEEENKQLAIDALYEEQGEYFTVIINN